MFSAMAYARRLHIVMKLAAIEQRRWLHSVQVSVQLASVSISMSNNCSLLDEQWSGLDESCHGMELVFSRIGSSNIQLMERGTG